MGSSDPPTTRDDGDRPDVMPDVMGPALYFGAVHKSIERFVVLITPCCESLSFFSFSLVGRMALLETSRALIHMC